MSVAWLPVALLNWSAAPAWLPGASSTPPPTAQRRATVPKDAAPGLKQPPSARGAVHASPPMQPAHARWSLMVPPSAAWLLVVAAQL